MPIGLKTSATIPSIELAMTARLAGTYSKDYLQELVASQTLSHGGQAEQVYRTLRHITSVNPLLPLIEAHADDYRECLGAPASRTLTLVATMTAAYPLLYDMVALLGRYFHAQDEVTTRLLREQLSQTYGGSVATQKAYAHGLKMLVEAGLIARPRTGVYTARRYRRAAPFARELYRRAFLHHNPMLEATLSTLDTYPYFEFIH